MKNWKGNVVGLLVALAMIGGSFAPVFADNDPKTTVCFDGETQEVTQGWMDAHAGQYTLGACPEVVPTLPPTEEPPADTTMTISAKALTDHECDSSEWHFVITQVDSESDAPGSINVTWANGNSASVSLDKFTGGVAHYTTTANLDSTVVSATATIYSDWSGQFNLSHGPCGVTPPENSASLQLVNNCDGGKWKVVASAGAVYTEPSWTWSLPYVLESVPAGSITVTWPSGTPASVTLDYPSVTEPENCLVTLPHTYHVDVVNNCDGYAWKVTVDDGDFVADMPLSGVWVDKYTQETSPNPSITITWDDGYSDTYSLGAIVEPTDCVVVDGHEFTVTPSSDCDGYSWKITVINGTYETDSPLSGVWTKKYERETSPNPVVKLTWDDGISRNITLDTIREPANCVVDRPTPEPTPAPVPPETGAGGFGWMWSLRLAGLGLAMFFGSRFFVK